MGVFVTDQRTIVIHDEPQVVGFKAGMKQMFGAEADKPPEPRPEIDFATVDISTLASMEGNQVVPHMSIEKAKIGKGIGGYGIWMTYISENLKKDYLVLTFLPPAELVKRRKGAGLRRRDIHREYAVKCVEVFRRALPPVISEKVEWDI